MQLTFNRGTISVTGDMRIPNSTWDERSRTFKAMALHYKDIIDYLKNSGIDFTDNVLDLLPCPELHSNIVLRDYQKQALDAWILNSQRGVLVLPTGSGKTVRLMQDYNYSKNIELSSEKEDLNKYGTIR